MTCTVLNRFWSVNQNMTYEDVTPIPSAFFAHGEQMRCPSIRLVPTSAPAALPNPCWHSVFGPLSEHGQTLVDLHLATGTFKWLQLLSFQGISRGSSIPWTPLHHLRARGGC